MDYTTIKEGKFEYLEIGEGEPLVLLHGLFGELSNFDGVINQFKDRYRILVPQMPLYDLPILLTNLDNLSKFLRRFLDHKKIEKAMLLGNSLGGHVGLVFANAYPKRVTKLILTGSSGLYENAFGGSFPKRESKEFLRERIRLTFYDQSFVTDELVDQCHYLVNNREKVIRILKLAKSAIRHNMESVLGNYTMPVCLIWGKDDHITPPSVAKTFNEKIKTSTLYWIDKCGHAPMMEKSDEFNAHLESWLAVN